MDKTISLVLVKSKSGRSPIVRKNLESLGLTKIGKKRTFSNVSSIRGKIKKIMHLVVLLDK